MSWFCNPRTTHQSHSLQVFLFHVAGVQPWCLWANAGLHLGHSVTLLQSLAPAPTRTFELPDSERRPDYLERTCADTGRTCRLHRSRVWSCSWREDSDKTKSTCVDGALSFRGNFPFDVRRFRFAKTQGEGCEASSCSGHADDTVLV